MRVTRIRITNYRGIEALDVPVNEHGAIATGGNAKGKTTVLNALMSALAARDISPDAIRHGSERAEILVDLDDVTVRRVIGPKKSSVSVSKGEFFLAKPKERRAKVLEVLPVTTSLDELRYFAPDLPDNFDVSGHGLDVLERARKRYFDLRTEANRTAAEAKRLASDAMAAAKMAPADDGSTIAEAQCAVAATEAVDAALQARSHECSAAEVRTKATRGRIVALRGEANVFETQADGIPTEDPVAERQAAETIDAEVTEIEAQAITCAAAFDEQIAQLVAQREAAAAHFRAQTTATRARAAQARAMYEAKRVVAERARAARAKAASLRAQAEDLAGAIGAALAPPSAEELAAAQAAVVQARARLNAATAVAEGRRVRAVAAERLQTATAAATAAHALDAVVKALTNDAPAALLAKTSGIPGLSLDGDTILLDGVDIDHVSSAEQLDFGLEIARRANTKGRVLIVDGLERLDPTQMEHFVRRATTDGYQLFASRVSSGDLVIEHLAADESSDAPALHAAQ